MPSNFLTYRIFNQISSDPLMPPLYLNIQCLKGDVVVLPAPSLSVAGFRKGLLCLGKKLFSHQFLCRRLPPFLLAAGSSVAFSPGNLSTSSSASSTLGSPENEEYILSFETIDKMRRVSSYSSLNSLIGE